MIRFFAIVCAFLSVIILPWPSTVFIMIGSSFFEPLVPLSIGIFADTVYYSAQSTVPLFTIFGAGMSIAIFFVRNYVKTSIIEE